MLAGYSKFPQGLYVVFRDATFIASTEACIAKLTKHKINHEAGAGAASDLAPSLMPISQSLE